MSSGSSSDVHSLLLYFFDSFLHFFMVLGSRDVARRRSSYCCSCCCLWPYCPPVSPRAPCSTHARTHAHLDGSFIAIILLCIHVFLIGIRTDFTRSRRIYRAAEGASVEASRERNRVNPSYIGPCAVRSVCVCARACKHAWPSACLVFAHASTSTCDL